MNPMLHLRWKRKRRGGFNAEFALALPLQEYDIRRPEGKEKGRFIGRFPLEGVVKTARHRQPNRRVPFASGDKIGLDVKNSRLELRWERIHDDREYSWLCHYELIVQMTDGRTMRAKLGGTRRSGNDRTPIYPDGSVETPFRDGAHAQWDSKALGVKAWAICGESKTEVKNK